MWQIRCVARHLSTADGAFYFPAGVDIKGMLAITCKTTTRALKALKDAWAKKYALTQKKCATSPLRCHDTAACCLGKVWSRLSLLTVRLVQIAKELGEIVHDELLLFCGDLCPLVRQIITDSYAPGQAKDCGAETRPFQANCTMSTGPDDLVTAVKNNDFNACVPKKKVIKELLKLLGTLITNHGVRCHRVQTICSRIEGCLMALWRLAEPNDRASSSLGRTCKEMRTIIGGGRVQVAVKRGGASRGAITMTGPSIRCLYANWAKFVREALKPPSQEGGGSHPLVQQCHASRRLPGWEQQHSAWHDDRPEDLHDGDALRSRRHGGGARSLLRAVGARQSHRDRDVLLEAGWGTAEAGRCCLR